MISNCFCKLTVTRLSELTVDRNLNKNFHHMPHFSDQQDEKWTLQ